MRSIDIQQHKRWVVKIGSALLTANGQGVDRAAIAQWVAQIVKLKQAGLDIILVSSGSVAEGMVRLGWQQRPHALHHLQAAAAVGQMGLISIYEDAFQDYDLHTAQVLITHDDAAHRKRYLNARQTLSSLLELGVIPIINENDTVATDEIRFGDNDTLAGMVCNLIDADQFVILTDQLGLFDADPRYNPQAKLITEISVDAPELDQYAQPSGGALGRGGMATKLRAARLAALSGAHTIIASGREQDVLQRLRANHNLGTLLIAKQDAKPKRKQWLAAQVQTCGSLYLDEGAVRALRQHNKSLLAAGVTQVEGEFERGDLVRCVDQDGRIVTQGLCNYNSEECAKILGKSSKQIVDILGFYAGPELIGRDNMVF